MRLFGERSIGGTLIPLNLWIQTDPLPIGMLVVRTRAKLSPNHFWLSNHVFSRLNPETHNIRSTISSVYLWLFSV
jgi:hypothetical protein